MKSIPQPHNQTVTTNYLVDSIAAKPCDIVYINYICLEVDLKVSPETYQLATKPQNTSANRTTYK